MSRFQLDTSGTVLLHPPAGRHETNCIGDDGKIYLKETDQ